MADGSETAKVVPLPGGPWLVAVLRLGDEPPAYAFVRQADLSAYGDDGMCLLPALMDEELPEFVAEAEAGSKMTVTIRKMTRRQLNRLTWVVPDEERGGDGVEGE